jgi:hypothetical protein
MPHRPRLVPILFALLLLPVTARAELIELRIRSREPFAGGKSFGDVGPYEKLVGIARFAIDPSHARNRIIVDLDRAPRNSAGKVEFEADFFLLAPKDPAKGNGAILYDVNNRGNKLALGFFNRGGGGNDPGKKGDVGDGFLFRRGYTVVWSGWDGELWPNRDHLVLRPPVATDKGKPIRGVVRCEMVADRPVETMSLSRREGHGSYTPVFKGKGINGTLTWRMRETDTRVAIPQSQWQLIRFGPMAWEGKVPGTLPQFRLKLAGGFRPGYIYELIYQAEGPIVQGVGFAGVRDLVSFLRYDAGKHNPLRTAAGKPAIRRAHGFGVSQSGRFLRHFLYQGFNVDEKGRKVFDGLMPHVAGGGLGFFNHRFAQPNRHNGQHEDHLYPADVFPFTYGDSTDPFSKLTDGICRRTGREDAKLLPRVMHTQSAAEYWHRSGSLVHTDPLGTKDAVIPDNVRIYAFGGTQHGPAGFPPGRGLGDNLLNPGDYRPQLRVLLDALDAWVRDGKAPPDSVYPTLAGGTLVPWQQKHTGFPALPGVRYPEVIQRPQALDLGPDFATRGIITIEPPRIVGNYLVLVPKSDPDGNDRGTLLPAEVGVPLATFTGWNLRRRDVGAEGMLASLAGSYIPFPRTREERDKLGDPRPSLQERYGGFEEYRKRFAASCRGLVKQRYLLEEDAGRLVEERERFRSLFTATK